MRLLSNLPVLASLTLLTEPLKIYLFLILRVIHFLMMIVSLETKLREN